MHEGRTLAKFVAETDLSNIPRSVRDHAKIMVLDNIACALQGSTQSWSEMVRDMATRLYSNGESTLFGTSQRANCSGAALANGVMIGAFESESADPIGVHPGANVFPAVLGLGEEMHSSGRQLLEAMILGYEIAVRIGEAATKSVEEVRGFHAPSTNGPFGAAAGAGKLLGLDAERLLNALGIAGSHCSGLLEFKWEGSMTKRLHLGRGGQMGLESALLAASGFTGPSTVLEGKHGYLNVFSASAVPDKLVENLGESWFERDLQLIKPYAAHATQLPMLEAITRFKSENHFSAAEIVEVRVSGSRHMVHTHDNKRPTSVMGAQYSMPFMTALGILRDARDPYVLTDQALWDEDIRALCDRVEVVADQRFEFSDPHAIPCAEIVLRLVDREYVIEARGFKGLPSMPFSFDDVVDKFHRFGGPVAGRRACDVFVELVDRLEELEDIRTLTGALDSSSGRGMLGPGRARAHGNCGPGSGRGCRAGYLHRAPVGDNNPSWATFRR